MVLEVRNADVNLSEELQDIELVLKSLLPLLFLRNGALPPALGFLLAPTALGLGSSVEVINAILLVDESRTGLVLEGVNVFELSLFRSCFNLRLLWQKAATVIK